MGVSFDTGRSSDQSSMVTDADNAELHLVHVEPVRHG
jgi:hypothetical protein